MKFHGKLTFLIEVKSDTGSIHKAAIEAPYNDKYQYLSNLHKGEPIIERKLDILLNDAWWKAYKWLNDRKEP